MPRGKKAAVGDKTVNKNGYEYTRTADRGWVGSHILLMEEHMKRRLLPGEYVEFVGENHSPPLTIDMIRLRRRGDFRSKAASRIAQIDARIAELEAEKKRLLEEASRSDELINA